jgi:hypothetical protein
MYSEVNYRVLASIALTVVCLAGSGAYAAESTAASDSYVTVGKSVSDMLVIESALALKAQQARELEAMGVKPEAANSLPVNLLPQPLMEPSHKVSGEDTSAKANDAPAVLGIFGTGVNLFADVSIDNQRIRFQAGQKAPLGFGSSSPYKLVKIKSPCVSFSTKGGLQTLCIDGKKAE